MRRVSMYLASRGCLDYLCSIFHVKFQGLGEKKAPATAVTIQGDGEREMKEMMLPRTEAEQEVMLGADRGGRMSIDREALGKCVQM